MYVIWYFVLFIQLVICWQLEICCIREKNKVVLPFNSEDTFVVRSATSPGCLCCTVLLDVH